MQTNSNRGGAGRNQGRKSMSGKGESARINFIPTPDMLAYIRHRAEVDGTTVSAVVRALVAAGLRHV